MIEPLKYQQSWLTWAFNRVAEELDHRIGWDKLPKPLGLLVLLGLRDTLRARNLYDTNVAPTRDLPPMEPFSSAVRTARTPDGTYNDLSEPRMGMAGARFGRNIPPSSAWPETGEDFMSPDPRLISNRLLKRKRFIPATSLNMLAATWIQFMVKDWFSHGPGDLTRAYKPKLTAEEHWPEQELLIPATKPDPTRAPGGEFPPTFVNQNTAWWDGSSIYGDSLQQQKLLRSGSRGKIKFLRPG